MQLTLRDTVSAPLTWPQAGLVCADDVAGASPQLAAVDAAMVPQSPQSLTERSA